jgi:hypothetical protein
LSVRLNSRPRLVVKRSIPVLYSVSSLERHAESGSRECVATVGATPARGFRRNDSGGVVA